MRLRKLSAFSKVTCAALGSWLAPTRLLLAACAICGALGMGATGCTPHIGDECQLSTNCAASGDRLCDITQPGGYCTIFNCEPDSCPDEAVCINFGTQLSGVEGCTSSQGNSPYQRSFCMAPCGSDADCRAGYSCQNLSGTPKHPNQLGAVLADYSGDGRVCAVIPVGKSAASSGASGGVCIGSDAGPVPETGAGGSAATGGEAGANDAGAAGSADAGAGGSSN